MILAFGRRFQRSRRSGIAKVRNHLIENGLDATDDWALWIDIDVWRFPRDIIGRLMAEMKILAEHGADLLDQRVETIMTREVKACSPDDTIISVMEMMTDRRIRHIPVLRDGALAGIVSIGDAVKFRLQELETEASHLRDYISH